MKELRVPQGQLTFDAEGNDTPGSPWFSRLAHVPGGVSGVTLGRGYDLGNFSQRYVEKGLEYAKIDPAPWRTAYGLKGEKAKRWLKANEPYLPEITHAQQRALFVFTYSALKADVVRLSTKEDVQEVYGVTDFDTLDPRILDLVVDLRYRGDYSPRTRKRVQPLVVENDLAGLARLMADRDFWNTVPQDRFNRRKDFLEGALLAVSGGEQRSETHKVQPGETLEKLSARFGVSVEELKAKNRAKLKTWGTIQGFNAGDVIEIPV